MGVTITTPPTPAFWNFIERLAPSGVSTINSSTEPAYDMYLIVLRMELSGNNNILLRLNADSGANYNYQYVSGTTPANSTGQTSVMIASPGNTTTALYAEISLLGKTAAIASGQLSGHITSSAPNTTGGSIFGFTWAGGNATQVTAFNFLLTAGTMTGVIEIWGRNLHS